MKLKTIWTLPSMQLMERCRRTYDLGFQTLAGHLPQRLTYWVTMQQISRATLADPTKPVMSVTVEEVMKALPTPKDLG